MNGVSQRLILEQELFYIKYGFKYIMTMIEEKLCVKTISSK